MDRAFFDRMRAEYADAEIVGAGRDRRVLHGDWTSVEGPRHRQ